MFFASHIVRVLAILILFLAVWGTGPSSYSETFQKETAIAVWDLEDLGSVGGMARPDLGRLLSDQVIESLQEKGYSVVERERLILALEELGLSTTSVVDGATRLRLGRLVGARLMVFGGYQVIENDMRLDLRLVEVETSKILKATGRIKSAEDLAEWLSAAKEATAELVE